MANEQVAASSSSAWMDKRLEPFRCRQCQKLLLKISTQNALKQGEVFQIKCACKTMNYLVGTGN